MLCIQINRMSLLLARVCFVSRFPQLWKLVKHLCGESPLYQGADLTAAAVSSRHASNV